MEFEEKDIQLSHDVPCYLFPGKDRKEKKNTADKFGRRYLCKTCHDIYERLVFFIMFKEIDEKTKNELIPKVQSFAKAYFEKRKTNDTRETKD